MNNMLYAGYHFLGMHLAWWLIWSIILFWIFATLYDIPNNKKNRKDSPLDILKKRFASGQIKIEEYQEKKRILKSDSKN